MNNDNKVFRFESGITVTFQAENMKINASNYNNIINYIDIVNFTNSNVYLHRLSPIGLAFRILGLGWLSAILILILVQDEWGAIFFEASTKDIFLAWLSISIGLCSFLIFTLILLGFVFSALMEISFLNRFIEKYFSDYRILAVIGNKSGKDIKFYTLIEELSKVNTLNEEIIYRKKTALENQELLVNNNYIKNDFHSNLKKLNELLLDNIITQEEFELKKKQILKM